MVGFYGSYFYYERGVGVLFPYIAILLLFICSDYYFRVFATCIGLGM